MTTYFDNFNKIAALICYQSWKNVSGYYDPFIDYLKLIVGVNKLHDCNVIKSDLMFI